MKNLRLALALAALVFVPATARATAAAGQGKKCDAANKCAAGLQCIDHHGMQSTCELVCTPKTKCPEDQRCVKDGAQAVCRPVIDL
jgi:hypothetical protein